MRTAGALTALACTLLMHTATVEAENTAPAIAAPHAAYLQQLDEAFTAVVARVQPAVVAIFAERTVASDENPYEGTPFERFFGPRRGPNVPRDGQGSGVIVTLEDDYYIITNNHVIRGSDQIRVQTSDDRHFEAEIVGADSLSDLAVLKVEADSLPSVRLGDSSDLQVGQWVLALGNPFGFEHTVTSGIVSALGRGRFTADEYGSFIQTDAAINPGNSGGPLVNLEGEVVGINTAIVAGRTMGGTPGNIGLGFAIPANLARNVLGQLVAHGEVRRGLLGIGIENIGPTMADALGLDSTQGVMVERVYRGRAAEKAGVEKGDVIVALDGEPVRDVTDLKSRIGATPPGTEVELEILREDETERIPVVLDELNKEAMLRGNQPVTTEKLGMQVQELTPELAKRLRYEGESGVLIGGVRRGSDAARQGLRPGDLIQEVERRAVDSVDDFIEAVDKAEAGDAILLLVRSGKETNFVALRVR